MVTDVRTPCFPRYSARAVSLPQPQNAALEYFQNMAPESLDLLGVEVIEGEHPGSTYYAAELHRDIEDANKAAKSAELPVRFVVEEG